MDTKFSVALHILIYIEESDKEVTSELLARSVGTNASYIRKITGLLKDSGIIETHRGKKGITLKMEPDELTLDKVYFAVCPDKELLSVHETANRECPIGENINEVLEPVFEESERQLVLNLKKKTLKNLIDDMYESYNRKRRTN